MPDLSKISIGIKTILRDELLYDCILNIRRYLPECKMIIADDGRDIWRKREMYDQLNLQGHKCITLPYDSGFGVKSNAIVSVLDTDYLLAASDDFDFQPPEARNGITKMFKILEALPQLDIVSGRVNNRPYEFNLIEDAARTVKEVNAMIPADPLGGWYPCGLTVNYSLIRRKVFQKVRWDDDAKIGQGEHAAFFVDCARAGIRVAYVPGVNINEQLNRNPDPEYIKLRNRARSPERSCFKKRGVKKYILSNGQVDYQCPEL